MQMNDLCGVQKVSIIAIQLDVNTPTIFTGGQVNRHHPGRVYFPDILLIFYMSLSKLCYQTTTHSTCLTQ